MPENLKEKVVKEISKNSLEKVVISLREWREKVLIDIRVQYQDDQGKWGFTKKGISLDVSKFEELKQGVLALEKEIANF